MYRSEVPRPFLKWAGGKTQLLPALTACVPERFNAYHEPFLGGGALYFALYRQGKISRAFLSDVNEELIHAYTMVRDHVEAVLAHLKEYPHNEDFYYSLRKKDPATMTAAERAARLIYLNKTCYNGLYRVNRQGRFNVPFGRYKTPRYYDPVNLRAVAQALRNARIEAASFEVVLKNARAGDLVYFDPPYIPVSKTASFTAYTRHGFSMEAQQNLRDVTAELAARGAYVMLSNSHAPATFRIFSHPDFHVYEVYAGRAINSRGHRRGKIKEVIITNFPIAAGKAPLQPVCSKVQ